MYQLLKPLLFRLPPETAHDLIYSIGSIADKSSFILKTLSYFYTFTNPALEVSLFDTSFPNPVGLAAGFDKHAHVANFMGAMGFGYVELGSFTAEPTKGNPKPRVFRLPIDQALINRMGLNNAGAEVAARRIAEQNLSIPIGISIAKTNKTISSPDAAIEDYLKSFTKLHSLPAYIVLSLSCPNTSDGRTFEDPESLRNLLERISYARNELGSSTPLLAKFSPDISIDNIERCFEQCEHFGIDGYVLCNTTVTRNGLLTASHLVHQYGIGGLSGAPLLENTISRVRKCYQISNGQKPIIAVGGIHSAQSAYRCIKAGASLIQLYTGLVYHGPSLPSIINRGLVQLLKHDGASSLSEIVGSESKEVL